MPAKHFSTETEIKAMTVHAAPLRRLALGLSTAALAAAAGLAPATAQDITMRLHTLVQDPHPYNDMAAFMAEEIAARTDGAIAIDIFPGATLGNDPAVIGEMALGTIDLMISSTNNAESTVPELAIFSMPYLFAGFDDLMEKVGPDSAVEDYFQQLFQDNDTGMVLLALGGSGTRNLSTATGPVVQVADIQGVNMRVPPSPMISRTWEALGTVPVTVAWAELYAAVQTGVADALESSIPGYMGSHLYEVAPNLALTAHTIQVNHVSMSEITWNRLSEEQQQIFLDVAAEASVLGVEQAIAYESEFIEELESEHGVTVTQPDIAEFQEVLAPVQEELAEELGLSEQLAIVRGES